MFQDLGALLSFLGSTDPKQADAFAAHLDSQGIPPPTGLTGMMKLDGPSTLSDRYRANILSGGGGFAPAVPGVESPGTTQPPPGDSGDVGLGSWMPGTTTGSMTPDAAQGVVDAATANPTGAPAGPGIGQALMQGAGQAGMKLAQPTPMPGPIPGVTGGVKAPEQHQINPGILQNLLALVMQKHGATPQGPNLGSLIR